MKVHRASRIFYLIFFLQIFCGQIFAQSELHRSLPKDLNQLIEDGVAAESALRDEFMAKAQPAVAQNQVRQDHHRKSRVQFLASQENIASPSPEAVVPNRKPNAKSLGKLQHRIAKEIKDSKQ